MKAAFNFTVVETDEILPEWHSRAFLYGDGLFETLIVQNGVIKFLNDHYQRLTSGMAALHMQLPDGFSQASLQNSILALVKTCQRGNSARVRLQIWRKPGGLYTPENNGVDCLITAQPLAPMQISVKEKAIFYEAIRLNHSAISEFKTTSALPYVMAGMARKNAQSDDAILLDVNGCIAECVASNIFWVKSQVVYTPSLESGCVAGIMRKNIIRALHKHPVSVMEGLFTKEHLLEAEAVFCCNVAGIQWIKKIEDTSFELNESLTVLLNRVINP